jgi:predicted dehydrogenase
MDRKLRLGIVGLDHWYAGLAVAEDAARNESIELVAIAHRDEGRGRQTAERFGAGSFTTDYMAVATRDDLDIVATACYCSENPALAAAAARAGSHLLSVKPIAMTAADAEQIRTAVRAAGVRFMSFESNYRVTPTFRLIKEWVDAGRIGRVLSAYTVLRSGLPTQEWPGVPARTWWLDASKTPGGGWIDHSIYHVDFLRWLLGDEVARVGADAVEHLADHVAGRVVPDDGDHVGHGADGGDVLRDVRRAAERELPLAHPHHRHGRLGRDPLDVAAEVNVQHRIADHRDAAARRGAEQLRQAGAGE